MPNGEELTRVAWHISSRSINGGGQCVEAGPFADSSRGVAVRHRYQPDAGALVYDRPEWTEFLRHLRAGRFDLTA